MSELQEIRGAYNDGKAAGVAEERARALECCEAVLDQYPDRTSWRRPVERIVSRILSGEPPPR